MKDGGAFPGFFCYVGLVPCLQGGTYGLLLLLIISHPGHCGISTEVHL